MREIRLIAAWDLQVGMELAPHPQSPMVAAGEYPQGSRIGSVERWENGRGVSWECDIVRGTIRGDSPASSEIAVYADSIVIAAGIAYAAAVSASVLVTEQGQHCPRGEAFTRWIADMDAASAAEGAARRALTLAALGGNVPTLSNGQRLPF